MTTELNLKDWHDEGDGDYSRPMRVNDRKAALWLTIVDEGICILRTDDRGGCEAFEQAIRDLAGVAELERKAARYDLISECFDDGDGGVRSVPNIAYIKAVLRGEHD